MRAANSHGTRPAVRLFRTPIVATGLLLAVLGAANWYTGHSRVGHYVALLEATKLRPSSTDHRAFRHLSAEMNTSLLGPLLDVSGGEYLNAQAKLDFFRFAEAAGKACLLIGLTFVVTGAVLDWQVRRVRVA